MLNDGHLVLTGPMGSGKTTVGAELARRLNRPFLDSDVQIGADHGVTGRDLAKRHGVEALHRIEANALREALASSRPAVIAAAASVADRTEIDELLADAHVVLLGGDPETLADRAGAGGHRRPVEVDDYAELSARRAARLRPLATLEVDVTDVGPEKVVEEILARLGGFTSQ